jgi:hypothetical protein
MLDFEITESVETHPANKRQDRKKIAGVFIVSSFFANVRGQTCGGGRVGGTDNSRYTAIKA